MTAKYDDLKWHIDNMLAGAHFVVPSRKLYEVYVLPNANPQNIFLNANADSFLVHKQVAQQVWYPAFVTVDVDANPHFSTLPHGWILSENETITSASAFTVRWRDVTALYCDDV